MFNCSMKSSESPQLTTNLQGIFYYKAVAHCLILWVQFIHNQQWYWWMNIALFKQQDCSSNKRLGDAQCWLKFKITPDTFDICRPTYIATARIKEITPDTFDICRPTYIATARIKDSNFVEYCMFNFRGVATHWIMHTHTHTHTHTALLCTPDVWICSCCCMLVPMHACFIVSFLLNVDGLLSHDHHSMRVQWEWIHRASMLIGLGIDTVWIISIITDTIDT